MEISQTKQVKVDAKTINIHMKVSDRFSYQILDAQGDILHEQDHYGDYVILEIDIDTGVVKNWKTLDASDIEAVMEPNHDH